MRNALKLLICLVVGSAVGCATFELDPEAMALIDSGRYEEGLAKLEGNSKAQPQNVALRSGYVRQRELAVYRLLAQADAYKALGRWEEAENQYKRVLTIDPGNARAVAAGAELRAAKRNAERLREAEARFKKGELAAAEDIARQTLREDPYNREAEALIRAIEEKSPSPTAAPVLKPTVRALVNLSFREASIRQVFDVLAQSAGINFIFDRDVRQDLRTTVQVRNATIEDVIRYVLVTNQLQQKVLDENTLLIYPNTPAKLKDYQDLVFKTFYLANADAKVVGNVIKTSVKPKELSVDENLNALLIRDTPETVRAVERLIASQDIAGPEVMLEVEVLEVNRDLLEEAGIKWLDQVTFGVQGAAGPGQITAREGANLTRANVIIGFSNPLLEFVLRGQDGRATVLANPRIRVKNREKARIHVGDKVPVITTTSTATGLVNQSVSYLDVGLKLEVEPNVHLVNEVAIKVGLEVSNIVNEIAGVGGSIVYRLGTRNASTVLRLKDGETQVLAGLINESERKSVVKMPGFGDLPAVGWLFSTQTNTATKTEVILLITPRVIRNIVRPGIRTEEFYSGTETNFGAPPLVLQRARIEGDPAKAAPSAAVPLAAKAPVTLSGVALVAPASGKIDSEIVARVDLAAPGVVQNAIVDLVFDPSRFEVVSVEPGEVVKQAGEAATFKHAAPAGQGRLSLSVTSKTDLPGRGEMAKIVLRVRGVPGSSTIRFEGISLLDKTGNPVPVNLPPPHALAVVR